MGYSTGTSTGPNDLIDKLRVFLEAEGWTTNLFAAVGAGYRLHVQKTAGDGTVMYFNFRSAIAETGTTLITENNYGSTEGTVTSGILINGSTGYDVGSLWHKQPGYPQDPVSSGGTKSYAGCMNPMSTSAIPAYYFFTVDDTVNVVVECTSGKFQFMSFGLLEKQGLYTGGQFFCASFNSCCPYDAYYGYSYYEPEYFTVTVSHRASGGVYVNADSVTDWRVNGDPSTHNEILWPCVAGQIANAEYTKDGMAAQFWAKSPNFYNNISAMCPIYTLLKRSDLNWTLLGWPSGVRFLNVLNYSAGQEIDYGTEKWKVFPANDVTRRADTVLNANCGFAFLKEV